MMIPSWINDGSEIEDTFGDGERAVQWLRRLKHPKNPARGHPFHLDGWQERIIRKLYGPRHPDGTRVARRLTLLLPRGGRKTSLCAAITLLHLVGPERQPGSLVLSAASAHEQALELFNEAALIVQGDQRLHKHLKVLEYTSTINFAKERSRYKAVASDGNVQHGKTPNVVIADELHAWEGRAGQKQWDALDSALVKGPGTLMIVATTSGRGQENLAWKTVEYAIKVQKGEIIDPATLPVIFMAEEGDDWKDEAVWHALNPGMANGYPDLASYRDKAQKAINSPTDRDSFLQFNLNRWLDNSTSPFVDMTIYDQGGDPIDPDQFAGQPCWIGVDLSSSIDLSVVVACFRDGDDHVVLPYFFCPRENLRERQDATGAPYLDWAARGLVEATAGNVVDFRRVEERIRELCERFSVQELAFDPALARNVMNNLMEDGYPVIEHRQGSLTMMPAIAELQRALIGQTFKHGGHPVLRFCFANVEAESNAAGHIVRFKKQKKWLSIDGAVAAAMAVGRCAAGNTGRSFLDDPNVTAEDLVL